MSGGNARVVLKRLPRPVNDLLRAYNVFIDDRPVTSIRRRQTKTLEVPPGHHEIHLTIDWCRSRSLDLDLAPGQEVKLICRARPMQYWGFLRKSDYIDLEPASDP